MRILFVIILSLFLVIVQQSLGQEVKYPVNVSAGVDGGGELGDLVDKFTNAVSDLGYTVQSNALILVDVALSVTGQRTVPGISPKSMVNFNVSVKIKDSETGNVLDSFSISGQGLGANVEEAIQKGVEKIKIDPDKLAKALMNCQDDYQRIIERRITISKQRFEEGKRLYDDKRYRDAIAKLKGVYPETEYFVQAQVLIENIRLAMPKPTIAVLDFKTNSGPMASKFSDILTTKLIQMEGDEIALLEREQMSEVLSEQNLELDGLVDPATASEFGRLTGADFIFLGSLTVSGKNVEVDGKIVRVGTSEIVWKYHISDTGEQLEMIAESIVADIHKAKEAGKLDKPAEPKPPGYDEWKKFFAEKKLKVMVMVPEVHIHKPIPDPAGETEIIRKFVDIGSNVVDQAIVKKIRDTEEAKAASKGDIQSAQAIARQNGAQIIIVGEAFSVNVPRRVQERQTCSARVEVRAIETDTGIILAANGKEATATDTTEEIAAKRALRTAGGIVADDMIKQIVESWKRKSEFYEIELQVRNIEYEQLMELESFLKNMEDVKDVQRMSFDEDVAFINIQSKKNTQNISDALSTKGFPGFKVKIETFNVNNIKAVINK